MRLELKVPPIVTLEILSTNIVRELLVCAIGLINQGKLFGPDFAEIFTKDIDSVIMQVVVLSADELLERRVVHIAHMIACARTRQQRRISNVAQLRKQCKQKLNDLCV